MDVLAAAVVYFLIWWVVLFTMLPLGVQRPEEAGEGHDQGAPRFHGMKKSYGLPRWLLCWFGLLYGGLSKATLFILVGWAPFKSRWWITNYRVQLDNVVVSLDHDGNNHNGSD